LAVGVGRIKTTTTLQALGLARPRLRNAMRRGGWIAAFVDATVRPRRPPQAL
jgi:hypothetical protein